MGVMNKRETAKFHEIQTMMIVMVMLLMVMMYSSPVTPITVKMLAATAAKIVVGLLINIGLNNPHWSDSSLSSPR